MKFGKSSGGPGPSMSPPPGMGGPRPSPSGGGDGFGPLWEHVFNLLGIVIVMILLFTILSVMAK